MNAIRNKILSILVIIGLLFYGSSLFSPPQAQAQGDATDLPSETPTLEITPTPSVTESPPLAEPPTEVPVVVDTPMSQEIGSLQADSCIPISFGNTLTGSISVAGEIDCFTFSGGAGDKVLVRMSNNVTSLWSDLEISGTPCVANGPTTAEIASCTLPSSGAYTILASDSYGTGSGDYAIHLQRLNSPGNSQSIAFGQTISASIINMAEMDAYTFTGNAGDKVLVRMSNNITALWSEVRVYGPDGVKLCENNGPNVTEIASCTLPANGVYTVLASDSYGTGYGDYAVHVQRLNNPGNAQSIVFGQTITASVISMAEMDAYTFTASAGDKALVRMSNNITALWSEVRVYSPDGVKLCENNGPNMTEIASCTLPADGVYTILTSDAYGTGSGDYAVHLQRLNNPGNSQSIAFGQTVATSVIYMAEMDAYTFTAIAGDKVLVRMSNNITALWSEVRVYSPDGIKLCENNGPNLTEIASCTLPADGAYTILTSDSSGTGSGGYAVHLQRLNNPGNAQSITFGQTISTSIINMAEMDAFTFTASSGDKVLVRMSNNITALWSEVRVYGPDGVKLCENNGPNLTEIASCTLPSDGAYAILTSDSYGTGNGDYAVHLQRLNNPGNSKPITFGQVVSASIIDMAEMDAFTFTAGTGDKVWLRMSNNVTSFWSEVRVYSPDGIKLCENNGPDTTEIASCTLPSNGVYTILASDSYGTGNGNYTLDIYHITTNSYHGWMLQSVGAYDGWVLESTENSNRGGSANSTATIFQVGDDAAKRQYRAILSFDTAVLPDSLSNAKIISVVLKIRRQGIAGTNPFTTHNGLRVDIRKPYFGPGLGLAASDFQASGVNLVGTFGANPVNNWYTATLKATAYPQINRTGTTQFRLRFGLDDDNDKIADLIKFYSGNAGYVFRPILIIKYKP